MSCDQQESYSKPLPWIGLYVAAASMVCFVCMTLDLVYSLGGQKLWIAPKFFPLNAATLTLLAVATKLPSDITTVMFTPVELFTNMSGVVLVSVAITHVMPCLGLMGGVGLLSNVAALGILVVTTFVNIMIQISTNVLGGDYDLFFVIFSSVMLLKFVIFVSYSLSVTTTKKVLQQEYNLKHKKIVHEMMQGGQSDDLSPTKMEEIVGKYWLMALTSSTDFTVLSSGMCSVSAMLDYISIFIPLFLSIAAAHDGSQFMKFVSEYKWSVTLIFLSQGTAITVGIVVSLLRLAKSRPSSDFSSWMAPFKIDSHSIFMLQEWREAPLPSTTSLPGRRLRIAILCTKILVVNVLIALQIGVVLLSKFFLFFMRCLWWISIGWVWKILKVIVFPFCYPTVNEVNDEVGTSDLCDLVEYILHLEENNAKDNYDIVKGWHRYPIRWIKNARNSQPSKLLSLLSYSCTFSEDFRELGRPFDKLLMPRQDHNSEGRQPFKCWSLPIVTVAVIAQTLAVTEQKNDIRNLMGSIGEGLKYVRFVEKNLGTSEALEKQEAADIVWEGIDVHARWLDTDLRKLVFKE